MEWLDSYSEKITQGCIIDGIDWGMGDDNPLSIVITNACDFEHGKCGYVNVLALEPAESVIRETKEFKGLVQNAQQDHTLTSKQWKSLSKYLDDIICNKNIIRYYFFDTDPVIKAGLLVADFQQIRSLEYREESQFEILGKMKSPFIEQLMIHYISYTGRIPSDRVDENQKESYINLLSGDFHK